MALVDYSSSGEDDGNGATPPHGKPPAKRQKTRGSSTGGNEMPPLPPEFHDLYAATVRQSTVDDPSLHQGRKRQVPHIAGQWPSHVYIEWRPSLEQHAVLTRLLAGASSALGSSGGDELQSLVTSDLETPLPLHVSLSRPLSLATADKDEFLRRAEASLGGGGVRPFVVQPSRLAWFTSPDSGRSFLVLSIEAAAGAATEDGGPLMALLRASNAVATRFSQPLLYADEDTARTAFHLSIAWTLARPRRELRDEDEEEPGGLSTWHLPLPDEVLAWRIAVDSVKVKIGNVVTSVALSGRAPGPDKTRFLFDEA
ncbi:Unidentified protein family UPF0406 [Cordyceps fumosorosea ARSEF 2679]|uniref:U6 snRNA phosphodiesterase n=1 Tax=Cordyceps fumosorosea (strain ARSEF 2679) TaxID=1081104 RepID=A0A167V6W5_CORFA|nr:Unidentified protein family UPF0406 [Cordyceps fumosorosea ARSEF 2679]OAA62289.1 Unidentified protein family UPF0406 [Cordyceps fumosorosea ARSEF 2679]